MNRLPQLISPLAHDRVRTVLVYAVSVVVVAGFAGAATWVGLPFMVILLGLVVLALSTASPSVAWAAYLTTTWLNGFGLSFGPATVRIEHFALLLLVAIAIRRARPRSRRSQSSAIRQRGSMQLRLAGAGIVLWIAIGFVSSAAVAPQPPPSLWMWLQLTLAVAALVLVMGESDKRRVVVIGNAVALVIGIGSVVGWFLTTYGIDLVFLGDVSPGGRMRGYAFEPNILASQTLIWLSLNYYWKGQLPSWTVLVNLLLIVQIIGATTRAAWVGLGVVALFWLADHLRKSATSWLATVLTVMAGGTAAIPALATVAVSNVEGESPLGRLFRLFDISSGTGAYRVEVYSWALSDLDGASPLRWLFGSGINSFSQYHEIDPTRVGTPYLSSIWLELLYDVGVVGGGVFVLSGILAVVSTHRTRDSLPLVAAIMITASATNNLWFAYPWIGFALLEWRSGEEAVLETPRTVTVRSVGRSTPATLAGGPRRK